MIQINLGIKAKERQESSYFIPFIIAIKAYSGIKNHI